MPHQTRAVVTVAILGGDPVVGNALELLLHTAGYNTRFLSDISPGTTNPQLAGVQLVLIAPGGSGERRKKLISLISSTPETAKTPILQLVSSGDTTSRHGDYLLWPCRLEELKQKIDAALLTTPQTGY